jgi:hypothetical protein
LISVDIEPRCGKCKLLVIQSWLVRRPSMLHFGEALS